MTGRDLSDPALGARKFATFSKRVPPGYGFADHLSITKCDKSPCSSDSFTERAHGHVVCPREHLFRQTGQSLVPKKCLMRWSLRQSLSRRSAPPLHQRGGGRQTNACAHKYHTSLCKITDVKIHVQKIQPEARAIERRSADSSKSHTQFALTEPTLFFRFDNKNSVEKFLIFLHLTWTLKYTSLREDLNFINWLRVQTHYSAWLVWGVCQGHEVISCEWVCRKTWEDQCGVFACQALIRGRFGCTSTIPFWCIRPCPFAELGPRIHDSEIPLCALQLFLTRCRYEVKPTTFDNFLGQPSWLHFRATRQMQNGWMLFPDVVRAALWIGKDRKAARLAYCCNERGWLRWLVSWLHYCTYLSPVTKQTARKKQQLLLTSTKCLLIVKSCRCFLLKSAELRVIDKEAVLIPTREVEIKRSIGISVNFCCWKKVQPFWTEAEVISSVCCTTFAFFMDTGISAQIAEHNRCCSTSRAFQRNIGSLICTFSKPSKQETTDNILSVFFSHFKRGTNNVPQGKGCAKAKEVELGVSLQLLPEGARGWDWSDQYEGKDRRIQERHLGRQRVRRQDTRLLSQLRNSPQDPLPLLREM